HVCRTLSSSAFHSHSFSYTAPPSTPIYTLSLHDALPISPGAVGIFAADIERGLVDLAVTERVGVAPHGLLGDLAEADALELQQRDRKSTRLNSSHVKISYAVFCLKKKKKKPQ